MSVGVRKPVWVLTAVVLFGVGLAVVAGRSSSPVLVRGAAVGGAVSGSIPALLAWPDAESLRGHVAVGRPSAATCVGELPRQTQLGQLLNALIPASALAEAMPFVAAGTLGGVTVLGSPTAEFADAVSRLRAAGGPAPPMVAVDEEGGTVQRLRSLLGALPAARTQSDTLDPEAIEALAADHGAAMRALGIDVDLAPVLDVGAGPGIGDRSYSDDPAVVEASGLAFAEGLLRAAVTPVVKHFPGHGRASGDSHDGLPVTPDWSELQAHDVLPFAAATEIEGVGVLTGHLVVPGLTDGLPASLSPAAVTTALRGDLGFDGLVMTDALNMSAISARWTVAEAAERALRAGNDIVVLGSLSDVEPTLVRLDRALQEGRLDAEAVGVSVLRVLAAKGVDACSLVA